MINSKTMTMTQVNFTFRTIIFCFCVFSFLTVSYFIWLATKAEVRLYANSILNFLLLHYRRSGLFTSLNIIKLFVMECSSNLQVDHKHNKPYFDQLYQPRTCSCYSLLLFLVCIQFLADHLLLADKCLPFHHGRESRENVHLAYHTIFQLW